jgi:hypothetical protein
MSRLHIGVLAAAVALSTACAVSTDDVTRWEGTVHGPEKLVAVVSHDKYRLDLRKDAVMSLIRMPPRGGTRQGIRLLLEKNKGENGQEHDGALMGIPDENRAKLMDLLAADLVAELVKPAPERKDGQPQPDLSIPFKDATFAMLVHEPPVITKKETREKLEAALVQWAQTNFEERLENSSQQYGLEQMMRKLGSRTAVKLPTLITENTYRVDRIVGLIADIGDDATKLKGAEELVKVAKRVESNEWFEGQSKIVSEYNKKNNQNVTAEQLKGQVTKMQERKLTEELFPAMRKIGSKPVTTYLYEIAGDAKRPEERRKFALAALEGSKPQDLERLFAIAKDESTPDSVRDLSFARLGELPKEQIVPKLYTLFEQLKKWKIRWVAGSLILRSVAAKQIPEFMSRLPKTNRVKMGMTEGLSFGDLIRKMEPVDPKTHEIMAGYLDDASFGAKMTAIGYFYEGRKADIPLLAKLENNKDTVPKCEKEDDCQWACGYTKPGTKEREVKEVSTLGEVVKFCIIPTMEK